MSQCLCGNPVSPDSKSDVCSECISEKKFHSAKEPAVSSGVQTNLEKIETEAGWYHSAEFDGEEITLRKYVKEAIQRAFQLGCSSGMGAPPSDTKNQPLCWQIKSGCRVYVFAEEPKVEPVYEYGGLQTGAIVIDELNALTSGMAKEPTK